MRFPLKSHIFLPLLIFAAGLPPAGAKDIVLFNKNRSAVDHYYEKVHDELQPGDRLIFSNGKGYRVGKRLGCGNSTCVYSLLDQPGRAIRIPSKDGLVRENGLHVREFIDAFKMGYKELHKAGVPMVGVHGYKAGEYVVVDEVAEEFSLRDFLNHPFDFSEEGREKVIADLLEFAKKTASFQIIGDFHSDQLIYVKGRGWVLVDWSGFHLAGGSGKENIFDLLFTDKNQFNSLAIDEKTKLRKFTDQQIVFLGDLRRTIGRTVLAEREELAKRGACVRPRFRTLLGLGKIRQQ